MKTRDQIYAIRAHEKVSNIKGKDGYKGYGSMSHKLPILIRTAGLAQTLTFVDARGKDLQLQLLNDLAQTIGMTDRSNLLARAREAELREYMLLTQQVLDALLWYKRFAQSILGVEAGEEDTENGSN